jgi:hypothetical protein
VSQILAFFRTSFRGDHRDNLLDLKSTVIAISGFPAASSAIPIRKFP